MAVYINGEQINGCTNYALAVSCVDKDGNPSTVQTEIDGLNESVSEQSKNLIKYNEETDSLDVYLNGSCIGSVYAGLNIQALIPILTSDTSNGLAEATNVYQSSGYEAFRAFDGNNSTFWSTTSLITEASITYTFAGGNANITDFSYRNRQDTLDQVPNTMELELCVDGAWIKAMTITPLMNYTENRIELGKKYTNVSAVRFACKRNAVGYISFASLQVYGRKL